MAYLATHPTKDFLLRFPLLLEVGDLGDSFVIFIRLVGIFLRSSATLRRRFPAILVAQSKSATPIASYTPPLPPPATPPPNFNHGGGGIIGRGVVAPRRGGKRAAAVRSPVATRAPRVARHPPAASRVPSRRA
jgi:hypothetical protein